MLLPFRYSAQRTRGSVQGRENAHPPVTQRPLHRAPEEGRRLRQVGVGLPEDATLFGQVRHHQGRHPGVDDVLDGGRRHLGQRLQERRQDIDHVPGAVQGTQGTVSAGDGGR